MPHLHPALLGNQYNGLTERGAAEKKALHKEARKFLTALAVAIGLSAAQYAIVHCQGSMHTAGQITLVSPTLSIKLTESRAHGGLTLFYGGKLLEDQTVAACGVRALTDQQIFDEVVKDCRRLLSEQA